MALAENDLQTYFSSFGDLHQSTLVLLLLLFVVAFWSFKRAQGSSSRNAGLRAIPSPPALPIIGHLHLLGDKPHRSLHALSKKYGPVMFLRLGSVPTVIVSSAEVALELLRTHDTLFATRALIAPARHLNPESILWIPYAGPQFHSIRKIFVTELLTAKRLEATKGIRASELDQMVSSILEDSKSAKPVVVIQKTSVFSTNVITLMAMKKRFLGSDSEASDFKRLLHEFFALLAAFDIGDYIPILSRLDLQGYVRRMKNVKAEFDEFLESIVEEHCQKNKNNELKDEDKDFVDVLLNFTSSESGGISRNMIKTLVQDMIAAGTHTTSNTVEWALTELLRTPTVMKKAQDELDSVVGRNRRVSESDLPKLKYLQAVVKEVFRVHPPGSTFMRETTDDCMAGGYGIPKKTRVIVNLLPIYRDPSTYENPEDFIPERFLKKDADFTVSPFGAGKRMCPAVSMGMIMTNITVAHLLQCFNWALPPGTKPSDIDMGETFGLAIPKKVPLEAYATPRLPDHCYHSSAYSRFGSE